MPSSETIYILNPAVRHLLPGFGSSVNESFFYFFFQIRQPHHRTPREYLDSARLLADCLRELGCMNPLIPEITQPCLLCDLQTLTRWSR